MHQYKLTQNTITITGQSLWSVLFEIFFSFILSISCTLAFLVFLFDKSVIPSILFFGMLILCISKGLNANQAPSKIVFCASSAAMEIHHRFGRSTIIHPFISIDYIKSKLIDDSESWSVELCIFLLNSECITVESAPPVLEGSIFSKTRVYQESISVAYLRMVIAGLTGIKDHGFDQQAK